MITLEIIFPLFSPSRIENSTSIPTTLYEFPNGYNINLTIEKYKLCEGLFDSSNLKGVSGGNLLSIPSVTINSAAMCDVDIRPVCKISLTVEKFPKDLHFVGSNFFFSKLYFYLSNFPHICK